MSSSSKSKARPKKTQRAAVTEQSDGSEEGLFIWNDLVKELGNPLDEIASPPSDSTAQLSEPVANDSKPWPELPKA